jgi:hypothetical protein
MPRQARPDAPGTLYHVIIQGIEHKKIVKDDHNRQNFVYRMGMIALSGICARISRALYPQSCHFQQSPPVT